LGSAGYFLIENNGYGLSTPTDEQYRCISLVDKAKGYGMDGVQIDGNDLLAVYDTIAGVRDYCIKHQKPFLVEAITFRMRGHEEASGTKYVPQRLFELWEQKDPVKNYETHLIEQHILSPDDIENIKAELKQQIESELEKGFNTLPIIADTETELQDVYAEKHASVLPACTPQVINNAATSYQPASSQRELRR
jgi:2-oxoisovalerate dehydrogenase E1 component